MLGKRGVSASFRRKSSIHSQQDYALDRKSKNEVSIRLERRQRSLSKSILQRQAVVKTSQGTRPRNSLLATKPTSTLDFQNQQSYSELAQNNKIVRAGKFTTEPSQPQLQAAHTPHSNQINSENKIRLKTAMARTRNHYARRYTNTEPSQQSKCQQLMKANFGHHDPQTCVCSDCSCGRHLCKLHIVKPDMNSCSVYKQDYEAKKPSYYLYVDPPEGKRPIEGPLLSTNSVYNKDFQEKSTEVIKNHPRDQIPTGGPMAGLTTYDSNFLAHKGANQYVKPSKEISGSGVLQFKGSTSYRETFGAKLIGSYKKQRLPTWKSHFKTGELWLGKSTYKECFRMHDKDYKTGDYSLKEVREDKPDFPKQYQTTYKQNYVEPASTLCHAKRKLENKLRTTINYSYNETPTHLAETQYNKQNMNQNAEFKSMSRGFRSISLGGACFA